MYNHATVVTRGADKGLAPTGFAATSPILTNVTFSGNTADGEGGGLYNNDQSQPTIVNSIFWHNKDSGVLGALGGNITNDSTSPEISNSLVQGSGGSSSWDSDAGTDNGMFKPTVTT